MANVEPNDLDAKKFLGTFFWKPESKHPTVREQAAAEGYRGHRATRPPRE